MELPHIPLDFLNLLFVPLMWLTAREVKDNWSSLWDDELTGHDRYLLQRIVIFFLIPIVVFCHELGHVLAIKLFGGRVVEFHYAFVWGYVIPGGMFNAYELVWLYLAGNLVQISIGLIALCCALKLKSPPLVALLTYLMLWSIGGTTIIYALLSFTGLYGDWLNIYAIPLSPFSYLIAFVHLLLVAFIIWCLYAEKAKQWFVTRTNPNWLAEHNLLLSQIKREYTATNLVNLAWSFYRVGLAKQAWQYAILAESICAQPADTLMLKGAIRYRQRKFKAAEAQFKALLTAGKPTLDERVKALIALASCQVKEKMKDEALATYGQAAEADPTIADPHFYKAMLLLEKGLSKEAHSELSQVDNLNWLDTSLADLAKTERSALEKRLANPP